MSLRFFADHCVSNLIIRSLEDAGGRVFRLRDHLQVENHPQVVPRLIALLRSYLAFQPEMKHYRGKLIVVEAHRIRIRG